MGGSTIRHYTFSFSLALTAAFGIAVVQCSSSRDSFGTATGVDDASSSGQFAPSDAGADVDASGARTRADECTGDLRLIYVVTRDTWQLYRFDPETLTFSLVGNLDCPRTNGWPHSMAIDRHGVAWIYMGGSVVAQVRLDNLACEEVLLTEAPTQGLNIVQGLGGMGFVADDSDAGESLYFCGQYVRRLDPLSLRMTLVGPTPQGAQICELTGTGDRQLFAYVYTNGVVTQLDPSSAAEIQRYPTGAISTGSFAFAQWGGDFYIFGTSGSDVQTHNVTRYSPTTGEAKVVLEDTGYDVIGAGVSTCAPYKPVN